VNRIQPGSFLTLHYRLAGPDGADVINTFGGKPATLSLGTGQLAPALEQRLIGLEEGARQAFDVPPATPSARATPSCCSV
jgi:FKBP-type peptidyl-prolyl cis-trans isomerase SlpA